MTKHTKKPFRLFGENKKIIVDANNTFIAHLPDRPTAKFIVRAVNSYDDMLEMLSEMVASHYCNSGCRICDKAKELIAKAKGEA